MFSNPERNVEQFDIHPGMAVADFGAGSGFYTISSAKAVGGAGRVFAVEVQKELLEKLKAQTKQLRLGNVEVIWGDIEKMGGTRLRDSSVDRVIASNVLFQLHDKKSFCNEIKRVLKPGGKVLCIDWSDTSPLGPKSLVTPASAKELFHSAGFVYDSSIIAGEHHYGLIFIKQ
ncbi:methyltransferase domain-containing protein [Patescibacteria group bacterium]|nr:MAG: methyltransferase domain-containing protein [Patescibacteria group bacterium]